MSRSGILAAAPACYSSGISHNRGFDRRDGLTSCSKSLGTGDYTRNIHSIAVASFHRVITFAAALASAMGFALGRPRASRRSTRIIRLAGTVRLPAEWEPHSCTMINWPSVALLAGGTPKEGLGMDGNDWIQECHYKELVKLIETASRYELVSVLVNSGDIDVCSEWLGGVQGIELIEQEHCNLWLRDVGPTFLKSVGSTQKLSAVSWDWHGYGSPDGSFGKGKHSRGRKALYENYCCKRWEEFVETDLSLAGRVAYDMGVDPEATVESSLTFEGGAIVTDGEGTGIVTWPMLTRMGCDDADLIELETRFKETTGLDKIIVLPRGLEDGGNGHADMVCTFIGPQQLLLVTGQQDGRSEENLRSLAGVTDAKGREINVVGIPVKPPSWLEAVSSATSSALGKFYAIRDRSYANLLFVDGAVLMPSYGDLLLDNQAAEVVRVALSNAESVGPREVVQVPWQELSRFGGGLRCISLPVPR